MRIRTRLFMMFIVLIGSSVLAAGIFSGKMIQDNHIEAQRSNLNHEVSMIVSMIDPDMFRENQQQAVEYYSAQAQHYAELTDARITFVRRDGKVLGDSAYDPSQMNNHHDRPEIQELLAGEWIGSSIRYSDTLGERMMYAAAPVYHQGEQVGYVRMAIGLGELSRTIYSLWVYLLLGLSFLLIVAGLISYRFAYGFIRPLEHIITVAKRITKQNYNARVRLKNRDEIGQLGQAINTMASSLQEQMEQITENENRLESVIDNMISGIIVLGKEDRIVLMNKAAEDILGYPAEQVIGQTYDKLKQPFPFEALIVDCIYKGEHIRDEITLFYPEERTIDIHMVPLRQETLNNSGIVIVLHDITAIRKLERMRSEFVANVSHELKTPIAAVKGFAETLLSGSVQDEETTNSFLQIIYDESERLNRLIADILELSKIESKREPLNLAPIQLEKFLKSVVEVMEPTANKKNIKLTLHAPDNIYIEADEDRLRQVFINLVSNAINYTPENGTVKVLLQTAGERDGEYEHVVVSVVDTGIGIPKKDLPRIFERFYRVDKARSRSSGGTGLGLSIVKHLIELHHGSIHVESELGYGSKFTVKLPALQS